MANLSPQKHAIKDPMQQEFEVKVRRCLLLEDVAPSVSISTIRTALGQFGKVRNVQILDAPLNPKLAAKRVLVEMGNHREALFAVNEMQDHPFILVKDIPRPVIATPAVPSLFPDRPRNKRKSHPGHQHMEIGPENPFVWVKPGDAGWGFACKQRELAKRHAAEVCYLMQELRKEEEKLAHEQEERAAAYLQKYELVESCMKRTVEQLRYRYGSSR